MNQKTNKKREFPYVKLILIVTLVLVVAIVGYSIVDSVGLIAELSTSGQSDNFKLNENITDVYRYMNGQQEFTYYYQYLSMYLSMYGSSDASSTISMINSLDPMGGTFIQYVSAGKTGLQYVHDHIATYITLGRFDAGAYSTLRQVLAYCEGAKEAKLYDTYKAEIQKDIDDSIVDMKDAAKSIGVTFSTFRSRYMGGGVTEKDIREALELQMIAAKYAEKLNDDYVAGVTTEQAEEYRDSHKESFYISSYYSVNLYAADLLKLVKECKTLDEATETIARYYFGKNYDTLYETHFKKANITDHAPETTKANVLTTVLAMNGIGNYEAVFSAADGVGTDNYRKAARNLAVSINTSTATNKTSLKAEVEKITKRTNTSATQTAFVDITDTKTEATDLQKWLFDGARKTNDFTTLTETSKTSTSSTATTKYTLYIAQDIMKWDTATNIEKTKDIFYVKLTDDASTVTDGKTAAQKAQLMYDALKDIKDKDAFAEKFEELLEKYQPGSVSSATIQEFVSESTITDKNLKAWVYNPLRKPGDLAILPLSEEQKKVEDEAAKAETETETEVETETETVVETETEATTEKETTKETETSASSSTTTKKDDVYLAFFVEENDATWEETCRTSIASEKLNDWFDAALEKYNVTVNYEFETTAETENK